MAIQMRRGLKADLDKSKLVAGEIVVKTDAREVGVAVAPSDVIDLATKDDIQNGHLSVDGHKLKWVNA